uniref:Secreted protein n=1 Tax=Ascaris lumbricoides TaxID=6252 RepID=A0A0M3HUC0_ASCLU
MLLVVSNFPAALTCHECVFIESVPAFVAAIARQANIMDGAYNYGDCKSIHDSCFTNGSCINLITLLLDVTVMANLNFRIE